jgi:hypothetical protein
MLKKPISLFSMYCKFETRRNTSCNTARAYVSDASRSCSQPKAAINRGCDAIFLMFY